MGNHTSSFLTKRAHSEPLPDVARSGTPAGTRSLSGNLMAATVWTKYQEQLSSLMIKLSGTHSRYVRCIKPNPTRTPKACDRLSTAAQLRCAGIVATVQLSRAVYPNSLPNKLLVLRFVTMWDKQKYPSKAKRVDNLERRLKMECEAMLACTLKELEVETDGKQVLPYAVGKTRTYFRKGALEWLEAKRVLEPDMIATVIEKRVRGVLTRLHLSTMRRGASQIQNWYRGIMEPIKY
jgi:myosin V